MSACTDRLCAQNKVVTQGITASLEVFHTGAAQAAAASSQHKVTCDMPRPAAALLQLALRLLTVQNSAGSQENLHAFQVPSTRHVAPVIVLHHATRKCLPTTAPLLLCDSSFVMRALLGREGTGCTLCDLPFSAWNAEFALRIKVKGPEKGLADPC